MLIYTWSDCAVIAEEFGFFIPVPRRPGQGEREALLAAGRRMDEELARLGLTEDELLANFRRWRKTRRGK